jgi:hypothetical protein
MDLELHEAWKRYPDRPCNKITYFIPMTFGIDYDASLGTYQVNVSEEVARRVRKWLVAQCPDLNGRFNAVILHYQGGSHSPRKNIDHWQAEQIIDAIRQSGRTCILWDWKGSQLEGCVRVPDQLWGGFGDGDAETMAAMIRLCEAFVGIDSGPGKVASSTTTPSLIVWTAHFPLRYHDPAENTTHLVRHDWRESCPIEGDPGREAYFRSNYDFISYRGEHDLVGQTCRWLEKTLGFTWTPPLIPVIVPPTVRAAVWVLAKLQYLVGDLSRVRIFVSAEMGDKEALEAADLYFAHSFIATISAKYPVHMGPEKPCNTRGHYLYVSDGFRNGVHYLVPDAVSQLPMKTVRDWLPDVPTDEEMIRKLPRHLLLCQ